MTKTGCDTRERMPRWMRRPLKCGPELNRVERILEREGLNTVCDGARCPNRGECFSCGTATFMIMGEVCTRNCGFCAVPVGRPGPLRDEEPRAVARAAEAMGLSHVVVTSVTRDDLADGGAAHFARTVTAVRESLPEATVEVLVPDFKGDGRAVEAVVAAGPDVFNHNIETVWRLYPLVRPEAEYERSLEVLSAAADCGVAVKSGFMVGLGESPEEVSDLLVDVRSAGCGMITAGQYLRPTASSLHVARYWKPAEFERLDAEARSLGFRSVAAGPMVRSSYRAGEML